MTHAEICRQIKNGGFWSIARQTYKTKEALLMRWQFEYIIIDQPGFLRLRKHQELKHAFVNQN